MLAGAGAGTERVEEQEERGTDMNKNIPGPLCFSFLLVFILIVFIFFSLILREKLVLKESSFPHSAQKAILVVSVSSLQTSRCAQAVHRLCPAASLAHPEAAPQPQPLPSLLSTVLLRKASGNAAPSLPNPHT